MEIAPASVSEIWERTIVRFQQRTGQKLDGASRGPGDLGRLLDAHYAAQADERSVAKAKKVGFQMIHCIQLLGGIVSQGASMAFAPAGLCFNALSFLLDIPKKVHEFHGEIDAIFAEVGPALAQFRIYERMEESSQIDDALRLSIYRVMTSFVNLCAECISIHHEGRWKSLKRTAGRILLDDRSIQSELADFKKLAQDQLNIQATLTLEVAVETGQHVKVIEATTAEIDTNTKAIKNDISGLVEAEHRRALDGNRRHILNTIRNKLGQKDDNIAAVLDDRDAVRNGAVRNSGQWLHEIDTYKRWIDRNSAADSVLVLTGESGTGKSYLVSAIAQEIQSANLVTKVERSLIGYYPLSLTGGRDRGDDRKGPEAAIKSICIQLAEQDLVYARRLFTVCSESGKDERYFRDATCMDLWATLGIGMPSKNMTHYILFDGVSTLSTEEWARLTRVIQQSNQSRHNRVRMLVSGEPETFQRGQLLSFWTKSIDITKYNEVDIKAFIAEEVKRASLLQGPDEDSQRRRRMVEERLLARSNNSYSTIQQDLRKVKNIIASGGTEEELYRGLHESITDPQELVRSDIETLEALLMPREIEEINELLIWAVAAHGYMDLERLAAALFLRFNTVSLQPLDEKISGKYSRLFTLIYGGKFLALQDHVRDCVVGQRDRPRQSAEDPKITATISITNADQKLVQRFLWDLNHHSFLGGFAFQPAPDATNTGQRKIQVYETDAHLEIVKRAVHVFQQPVVDQRGKALGAYLMRSITFHLKALSEATGLDEIQPADKQLIGSHVYEMFNDGDLIERNWEFCNPGVVWFADSGDMDIFWRWLDDPVAIAQLGRRDKRWLADLKRDEHRNSRLLTPIMTMIAEHWLQKTEWDVFSAFHWISGFLTLGAKSEQDDEEAKDSNYGDGQIIIHRYDSTLEKVAKAEQWCKEFLNAPEANYMWYIRLGDTCARLEQKAAASEHYKKAATMVQAQDPTNREPLGYVFKALSDCAADEESALEYLKEASKLDEDNPEILYTMRQRYIARGKEGAVRSIIEQAIRKKAPDTMSNLLIATLTTSLIKRHQGQMFSVLKAILSVVSSSPQLSAVFQHEMNAAVDAARTEGKEDELAILLLQQGIAGFYLHEDSPPQFTSAAGHLRECLDIVRQKVSLEDRDRLDFIEQSVVLRLSMFYLERAMHTDGEGSEAAVERLRQMHEDDPASRCSKSILASLYTFQGQRDKARDTLRSDMVEAFNILVDDDFINDVDGFTTLRTLLNHSGDHENALRAALLLPKWQFDDTVLAELLAGEEPSLVTVREELLQFYQTKCRDKNKHWESLQEVWHETSRLASSAAVDRERAACYDKVQQIFAHHERGIYWGLACKNCDRPWDYEHGLHACKYCYNVDLCDACWEELRSGDTGNAFVCSSTHDWYDLPPLTREQYFRACKELVLVQTEDGGEELVSVSQWLATLCEGWGLAKGDWNFG